MTDAAPPLTLGDFTDPQERRYRAATSNVGAVELELIEWAQAGDPRPFSLLFRGPLHPALDQGTFELTRADSDEPRSIFLVPVAQREDGLRYEAIFA